MEQWREIVELGATAVVAIAGILVVADLARRMILRTASSLDEVTKELGHVAEALSKATEANAQEHRAIMEAMQHICRSEADHPCRPYRVEDR